MKIKKALCLASMASNLDNFNRNNVKILRELGYDVTLASNFHTAEDSNSQKKTLEFMKEMESEGIHIVQIDFSRKIGNFKGQIRSYNQVKKLLTQEYDLIHCHAPICAAITRLCAKKYRARGKTKVIYTAHGFHFYKGAPLKNWLLYYPVEWICSFWTDVQITINREDYERARKHFHAKKTIYVPGVGIDTEKFKPGENGRKTIRRELGLNESQTMLLSVGELNENKNHEAAIRAIAGTGYTYVIVGTGGLRDKLQAAAKECGTDLRLMGYRSDVADFYDAADCYVLPSIREGLNVSLMEAMASGLPVACGKIRGNTDLISDDGSLFDPKNTTEILSAVKTALEKREELSQKNLQRIRFCDLHNVESRVRDIYGRI